MARNTPLETPLTIRKQPKSLRCNSPGGVHSQPHKSEQPSISIQYKCHLHEGTHFEFVKFAQEANAPSSDDIRQRGKISDIKTSEMLTTTELISAIGQLWDTATRPLPVLQSRANLRHPTSECLRENTICYMGEEHVSIPTSSECKLDTADSRTLSLIMPSMDSKLKCSKASQGMSLYGPDRRCNAHPVLSGVLQDGTNTFSETWKGQGLASVGISYNMKCVYNWMNISSLSSSPISEDTPSPENCCIAKEQPSERFDGLTQRNYLSPGEKEEDAIKNASMSSLYSGFHGALQGADKIIHTSQLCAEPCPNLLASQEQVQKTQVDDLVGKTMDQHKESILENERKAEIHLSPQDKPSHALAKQEHAFAGALTGIFVSLCLHPMDTVKTVTQSCGAHQSSISHISRSIISDRGLTGLYRGISSKIASSAPISALYTFTYESMKGALLPFLPKEYYPLVHCMAGACASIATSFIFTPSEHIKQQMQVGSRYKYCWNALVGILKNGGLPSLYAGWGAVLCRNVPHSIIKFYTYESLKQLTQSSLRPDAQLTTIQSLVFGGLAGSTAALFTTPFDVVKTRLQTQIPGSVNRYGGVFQTLQHVGMHEGLKGLYRGLTPRLVMYMSQGALFFVSYESFKRLFSL